MRIEMHDMEVFVALSERTHDGKRHEMLAADHEGLLAIGEQVPRKILDLPQSASRIAKAKLQVAAVKDACLLHIEVEIRAVRLQPIRLGTHRAAREARARPKRRRRIKWCAEEHDARLFV